MSLQDFYKQYAPKNKPETFEEEKRRIELERLAKMQSSLSNINAPIESSEPTKVKEPPKKEVKEEPSLPEEKETRWANPEVESIVNQYLGSTREPVSEPSVPSTVISSPVEYTKPYSLVDLDSDKHFQKVANRFLTSIGTDEDIYETLRDSDWSVTDALVRAYNSGKWTDQQKADYKYLRTTFDNASLGSFRHILEATKDIGIDIVADPLNLLAGLFTIGTGGVGVAGAGAVAKIASSQAVKTGAKKLANRKGFRAVSIGLTEGAYDAGTINAGTQLTEIQTNIRKQGTTFNPVESAVSVGLGAAFGGAFVGGAHKLTNYMLRKEADSLSKTYGFKEPELLDEKGFLDSEKIKDVRRTLDRLSSVTQGKALTKFVEDAKGKTVFTQNLLNLRQDTFRRAVFGVRKEKIQKANMTFSREAEELSNTGVAFIQKALQPLGVIKEGNNFFVRLFNSTLKLSNEDDLALLSLQARGDVLDKYITINAVNTNRPLHEVTAKVKQDIFETKQMPSGLPIKDRLSEEEFSFLKQFNKLQLEAAAKLRYFNDTINRLGSNIDAIDPQTGKAFTEGKRIFEYGVAVTQPLKEIKNTEPLRYARSIAEQKKKDPRISLEEMEKTEVVKLIPYSIFKPDQKVKNYITRIFTKEAIDDAEKRKILIPALAKTSHSKTNNEYVKVEGILEGTTKGKVGRKGIERDYIEDLSTGLKGTVLDPKQTQYLTKDQLYFKNVKTKNLPHIDKDGEAEIWLGGRYDTFEDIAIASLEKEGIKIPTIGRNAEQENLLDTRARLFRSEALIDELSQRGSKPDYKLSYDDYKRYGGSTDFLNTRKWGELEDQFLIDNGFIQTDVASIMTDYAWKIGHKINEEKYLGYGSEYYRRYLDKIENELGISDDTTKVLNELSKIRDFATGGRLSNVSLGKYQKGIYDAIKVSQVLAHLPFAALSSITEPLIALGRSDLADTPAFVKEFSKGLGKSTKKSMQRFYVQMQTARGKKVKAFKDLSDEDWLDAYRAGVATEQAMLTKIEGMFAEGLQTGTARNIINTFFNLNFLQQWTQGVQLGAFNYSKERSIRIISELADDTNAYGIQLTKNSRGRRADQLREIGIDPKQGVTAYRRALDENGFFNRDKFNQDAFYDTELIPASALFSKEIILNPSAAELNKPLWFNTPGAAVFVQFAGYPTAFNNTVLKGFVRDVIRHPVANTPKVIAATGMMAGVATMTNAIRSGGASLENKKDIEIVTESFERPGLLGWLQHFHRYYEGVKYGAGPIGSGIKSVSGPFGGDIVDGIAYRTPWFEIVGTNLPGYGALSPQAKRDFKKLLKEVFDKKEFDIRLNKDKGGLVLNVPNAVEEPDELKMRGLPYSYSELAGPLFQDEEERGAFAEGGKASIKETDEAYVYITKDEDAYNIQLNKNPIDTYTEEELPELEVKDTYYTGFKGNTVSDRLNSVRQSSTIGLPVTKNKTKAKGGIKAAGKIKFKNVLKLDINSVTPDSVQAEINKNIDSIIKIEDKVLAKEIVKATNDNLAIRDDIFNNDPDKTSEKKRVVERSKSFLVRQQLLKLSYDALETKEGYVLLRENQFLPTEIMKRKTRLTGRLNYRYGKKVKKEILAEATPPSVRDFFEEQQYSWEGDHGNVPMPTNDAREQQLSIEERSTDIGFGHKVTNIETETGLIHGIPFIDKETGEFINLTLENKRFIKEQDILQNVNLALSSGWNTKLQERGLNWDTIPDKYKLPLEDLAYNVGGKKAGETWTNIFDDVQNDNVSGFVKNLRRQDAGQNTAGMDNRAAKAAAASGLITSYEQALEYGLELATEKQLPFVSKIFERQQYNEGGESYGNVIAEDYKEELQGLKDMLTDPVGMIDSVSQLGLGAIALAIPDKYQEQKLNQYEELAKGVGQSLVNNFGTLEKAKQTIINNPVGTAATVSGLLFGGGVGLKKIADAAKVSKASQAGSKMIKVSDAVDPIIGPILGAGKLITRRDFNTGVTGAALASAIPASKILDEVKTVKKLTGISKFRNLSNIFKPHLIGSVENKKIRKKINDKMFNEIKRTKGEREAISYRASSRRRVKEVEKINPSVGYEKLKFNPDATITKHIKDKYNLDGGDFSEIGNHYSYRNKLFKNKDRDTQLKLTYELQDELLKISKQLDNAPDKKIFNYKLNESPIRIDRQPPAHRARKENWNKYTETKGDYGEKIKYNITVGTVEGIPVFKIGDTQAYDEVYIPNSTGLSKLAKQKNNITKRNLLTGLRDRNNKGGEVG